MTNPEASGIECGTGKMPTLNLPTCFISGYGGKISIISEV